MVNLKGLYEWKLIDKGTRVVLDSGSQWNTISDQFLQYICNNGSGDMNLVSNMYFRVQLSSTVPTPGANYRVAGASNGFVVLAQSNQTLTTVDRNVNSFYKDYTFNPPGSPLTINTIGVQVNSGTYPNFVSFIALSTPITQQTNQYLYVKYTMFIAYTGGGLNQPSNRFISRSVTTYLNQNGPSLFGYTNNNDRDYSLHLMVTTYMQPTTLNNVQRVVPYAYITVATSDKETNTGSTYANKIKKSFATTDIPGPIGAVVFGNKAAYDTNGGAWAWITHGYSPVATQAPSISRVFVHPSNRLSQIFSDPSYPPSSQGSVVLTGTPTNKFPVIGRVRITRTGDASDIVDETVSSSDVDASANTFLVAQVWAVGDKVRLTTDNTLPSPLLTATDYYVIYINTTHIKFALTYSDAIAGTFIDLLDQGIGNHTLYRQNTAQYLLELEPWIEDSHYLQDSGYPSNTSDIYHIVMAQDAAGTCMPTNYTSYYDYGEGGTTRWLGNIPFISGQIKVGNYLYTIQKSLGFTNLYNVCRWTFNTVETSQALCSFGNSSTVFRHWLNVGGLFYLATSDGIYQYDPSTPTVAPSLLTITGIIDNNVTDIAYDSITGYLWSGHLTGVSKINLGTLIATQYIRGTGNALEGMAAADAYIIPGCLSACNGIVAWSSYINQYYYGHDDILYTNNYNALVLQDGVGWLKIPTYRFSGLCVRQSNQQIVTYDLDNNTFRLYTMTITGKGTGTATLVESFASGYSMNPYRSQIVQINDTDFFYRIGTYGGNDFNFIYRIGTGIYTTWQNSGSGSLGAGYTFVCENGQMRNLVDVNGSGLNVLFYHHVMFCQPRGTWLNYYGWTGGVWTAWDTTPRYVPKTATHALLDGVTADFNNAVGQQWDQQFILGERFTFLYAPTLVKDNLQTFDIKARYYYSEAHLASNVSVSVPLSASYEFVISQQSNPNFRDMDNVDYVTEVYEGVTRYTVYTLPAGNTFTVNTSTDQLTVAANIATGTPLIITAPSGFPASLVDDTIYYAINVDTTHIRLATTYANSLSNTYIDLTTAGSGTLTVKQVVPTTTTYYAGVNGIFIFSSIDAGKSLTVTYTYTYYS
jgi:hypothetical protein